jgi:hypothetical protein
MDSTAERIRDKLWSGVLPNVEPLKTWGGYGSGGVCDGCDSPIESDQAEHEVDLPDERRLRFHVACAALWQVLRGALPS